MDPLRIYVDLALPADAHTLLAAGTAGHRLIQPASPVTSVLAQSDPDPQFEAVDIAFGQPSVAAIVRAPQLRWIHISSAGITRYDTPEFRALAAGRGVPLTNSSSVYDEACAVHALSFLLAQVRQLPRALCARPANGTAEWNGLRAASGTLRGAHILLIGMGAIGKRLAELLQPFGVRVTAHRRRPRGDEGIPVVGNDELAGALATADHVVNLLPEGPGTRGFFGPERFSTLRAGAAFYNLGRGATVNQEALLAALRSGRLGAAWLDVTDPEPLPDDHPLRLEPNCFITPHTAGGHAGEATTLVRHFLDNFGRFVRGDALRDRVF